MWTHENLDSLEVPLAVSNVSPVHAAPDYYYSIPVRLIYKTYPIYHPGKEPSGYLGWLRQQEPEIIFDASQLKTEEDWLRAGEIVFDAPISFSPGLFTELSDVRDPAWYEKVGTPVAKDGTLPFFKYVVREKGKVELAAFACANCHTRVMPGGEVIKGAQGNFPMDRAVGYAWRKLGAESKNQQEFLNIVRLFERFIFDTPWLNPNPHARLGQMSLGDIASNNEVIPPGVVARQRASLFNPVCISDLIGIKERRYLDRTGLVQHRSITDMMLYGALNQGADDLSRFGDFCPAELFYGKYPDPARLTRYSDEQLYALALYLYSLKPPPNPHKFDDLAARGEVVFKRENCAGCHTPPLYTNNKLTPVKGFKVPEEHQETFDVLPISVGTNPHLALNTRRGTGYYKVPSLKGVWYRGPFTHSGAVATLEDWFDPRRTRDDYTPTGYRPVGVKTQAVQGHPFGLKLSAEDRKALIAFLNTL